MAGFRARGNTRFPVCDGPTKTSLSLLVRRDVHAFDTPYQHKHPGLRTLDMCASDKFAELVRHSGARFYIDIGGAVRPRSWLGLPGHVAQPSYDPRSALKWPVDQRPAGTCAHDATAVLAGITGKVTLQRCECWKQAHAAAGGGKIAILLRHTAYYLGAKEFAELSTLARRVTEFVVVSQHWHYAVPQGRFTISDTPDGGGHRWDTEGENFVVNVSGEVSPYVYNWQANAALSCSPSNHLVWGEKIAYLLGVNDGHSYAACLLVAQLIGVRRGRFLVPTSALPDERRLQIRAFVTDATRLCHGLSYTAGGNATAQQRMRSLYGAKYDHLRLTNEEYADAFNQAFSVWNQLDGEQHARFTDTGQRAVQQRARALALGYGAGWWRRFQWKWGILLDRRLICALCLLLTLGLSGLVVSVRGAPVPHGEPVAIWSRCLFHIALKPLPARHSVRRVSFTGRCAERIVGFFPAAYATLDGHDACYYTTCPHNELLALHNRHLAETLPVDPGFWTNGRTLSWYTEYNVTRDLSHEEYVQKFVPRRRAVLERSCAEEQREDLRLSSFVKAELSKPYVLATRARLIQGMCGATQVRYGPSYAALAETLKVMFDGRRSYFVGKTRFIPVYGGGLNPEKLNSIVTFILDSGRTFACGDYREYDASQGVEAQTFKAKVYTELGLDDIAGVTTRMLNMRGRTQCGTSYRARATTPSGRGDTSSGNFITNLEALCTAISRLVGDCDDAIYVLVNGDDWLSGIPRRCAALLRAGMVAETARAGFNLTVFNVSDYAFDFCSGYFFPVRGRYFYGSKPFRAIHRFHVRRKDDLWPAQVWHQADALVRASYHIPVLHEFAVRVREIYGAHAHRDIDWSPNKYSFNQSDVPHWDDSTLDAFCLIYDVSRSDVGELLELVANSVIGQDLSRNGLFARCLASDMG